ncbi:SDR family NAD(P)-dependent oxidoreductase [Variovorax sp. YR266]|uniref:SDR family NAD(P)-dependent oxidoreductase n=1 Tax=Variovorax sp. YR266 TaxID=1884386 RepID=UPI000B831A8A|nr:SDR family oxidoreductase [Variovorax sp. YR266]
MTWLGLEGRVCVVTGAGRGIGAGVAHELARHGAHVAVLDRDAASADAVAAEIASAGGRSIGLAADVTQQDAIAAAAERVQRELGACHVLVNNAALVGYAGPLMDADLNQWNRMLDVNVTGTLICTRAFGRQMIVAGQGGAIVNVASICGHLPLTHGGVYSVGKAGLLMLTRMLALELAEHGVRCNSVSPGLVRTPATEAAYGDSEVAEARRRLVPIRRISEPEDLATVIAFLASDRAGYVDGQDVLVDGALSQSLMGWVPRPPGPMRPS